jgi:hypothetical protein
MIFLPISRAASTSDLHQLEASHAGETRQHDLAAMRRLLQSFFPALSGDDAALGIKIEEDVLPAICGKPVADLGGLFVVPARMADEDAGHDRQLGAS